MVLQPLMGQMQISSMHVHNNLLVAGGVDGELVCKVRFSKSYHELAFSTLWKLTVIFYLGCQYLDQSEVSFSIKSTFDESAIKNAIEIDEDSGYNMLRTCIEIFYICFLKLYFLKWSLVFHSVFLVVHHEW